MLRFVEPQIGPVALDRDRLAALKAAVGSTDVERLLRLLSTDLVQNASVIAGLIARGDIVTARRAAHSLKGGAMAVGATILAEAAAAVEKGNAGERTLRQYAEALCDAARVTLIALDQH